MKAAVLKGQGLESIAVEEVPLPVPAERQLLARVDAAGVCTSILKLAAQGERHSFMGGWDPARWPIILGDEGSLTVVEVGRGLAHRYTPGMRLGLQPAVVGSPINHLERYRDQGRYMEKTAVGYTLGGCLAQYLLVPEEVIEGQCLLRLPDEDIPHYAVSMCEPISCAISAQYRHIHLGKNHPTDPWTPHQGILGGGVCVVIGAGTMGRINLELAMRYRPGTIVAVDPVPNQLEWVRKSLATKARTLGIDLVTCSPNETTAIVEERSGGRMASDVIVAVGKRSVQEEAVRLAGRGGVVNLFGGLPGGDSMLQVDALRVHYDEMRLVGSSGGDPFDLQEALISVSRGDIEAGRYVAAVGSLDALPEALRLMRDGRMPGRTIIYPHLEGIPLRHVHGWSADEERKLTSQ